MFKTDKSNFWIMQYDDSNGKSHVYATYDGQEFFEKIKGIIESEAGDIKVFFGRPTFYETFESLTSRFESEDSLKQKLLDLQNKMESDN